MAAPVPDQMLPGLHRLRVLVVEDEAVVAMLVEDELVTAGATVIGPAGSLIEALDLLDRAMRNGGLDAGVLDLNLGGESVLPVADILARHAVPFLVMTGYEGSGVHGPYAAAPTIRKPFTPAELIAALCGMLDRPVPDSFTLG